MQEIIQQILQILPFLVGIGLIWFTYLNVAYVVKVAKTTKEHEDLEICLNDTGKIFYIVIGIIYVGAMIGGLGYIIYCALNGDIERIYLPLNIITVISIGASYLFQQIVFIGKKEILIGKILFTFSKMRRASYNGKNLTFTSGDRVLKTPTMFLDVSMVKKAVQRMK